MSDQNEITFEISCENLGSIIYDLYGCEAVFEKLTALYVAGNADFANLKIVDVTDDFRGMDDPSEEPYLMFQIDDEKENFGIEFHKNGLESEETRDYVVQWFENDYQELSDEECEIASPAIEAKIRTIFDKIMSA